MGNRLLDMIFQSTSELTTSGLLLRLALAVSSVFALVHLLSLWGTRYGDNNTLSKSFFLSLVFHCCLGLGWATVAENYPQRPIGDGTVMIDTPITFVDDVDSSPVEGTNKLPIFQSGPSSSGVPLTRDTRSSTRLDSKSEMAEVAAPQRDKTPETKVIPDLPNVSPQVEEQSPQIEHTTDNIPMSAASSQASIDQPALEARPEITIERSPARATVSRSVETVESSPRPTAARDSSARTAPLVEDSEIVTFPADASQDELSRPQGVSEGETIRRQGNSNPAPLVDSAAGNIVEDNNDTKGDSLPRRMNRRASPNLVPGNGQDDISTRPSIASKPSTARSTTKTSPSADDRSITGLDSLEPTDDSPQPSLERLKSTGISKGPARAPETYRARTSSQRLSSVLKNGGTEESEQAVENSLKWLASMQEQDGSWSAARHGGGTSKEDPDGRDRMDGGKFADSGVTGLVVLSFLGAGYSHEKGPYTAEVKSALDWLIEQQGKSGYLGGKATRFDQNYCHAIATFALAEAYAMQKDANDYLPLRNAVRRGVDWISSIQNEDGGWRYGRGDSDNSDMSMFGWQLMALKSAVNGGIPVPEKTRRGMVRFLEKRGRGEHGGLAGYRATDQPTPAMTAEALFCRQMFTVRDNDMASQEATSFLLQNLPRASAYDEYYWYYGTLAMRQVDGTSWKRWNESLRDLLISMQRQQGPHAGSWDPRGKWAGIGGRLYSTALSTMCLEAYYRYQSNSRPVDNP